MSKHFTINIHNIAVKLHEMNDQCHYEDNLANKRMEEEETNIVADL